MSKRTGKNTGWEIQPEAQRTANTGWDNPGNTGWEAEEHQRNPAIPVSRAPSGFYGNSGVIGHSAQFTRQMTALVGRHAGTSRAASSRRGAASGASTSTTPAGSSRATGVNPAGPSAAGPSSGRFGQQGAGEAGVDHAGIGDLMGGGVGQSLTPQERARIEDLFSVFDEDGSGTIEKMEMRHAMGKMNIRLGYQEFEDIFSSMDRNGDGSIDFEEYMAMMTACYSGQSAQQELSTMYQLFAEARRNGQINLRTFERGTRSLGLKFTQDEIRGMFYSADKDGNGFINIDEFAGMAQLVGDF